MRMFNPDGTEGEMSNVTFATVVSRDYIKIREWERGTGETIGCARGCVWVSPVVRYIDI